MAQRDEFVRVVEDVVNSGRCSGCGGCAALSDRVRIELSPEGQMRPTVGGGSDTESASSDHLASEFERICPGVSVPAPGPGSKGSVAGAAVAVWKAWALDPEVRQRGSSGGVITALSALMQGEGATVIGVAIDLPQSRAVPLTLRSKADVMQAAGSKYAPVAVASSPDIQSADAIVAKPCESYALRQLDAERRPILLSFFCAGTPSARATEGVLRDAGLHSDQLSEFRYRGEGWPGSFHARDHAGTQVTHDYATSWGELLGPAVQQRCKFCADGVGEHADLVAGDLWHADKHGDPSFDEADGVSVLIARTERGRELALRAQQLGVLHLEVASLERALAVQPHQRNRRETLWGRLVGARLAGATVTAYPGFGLWRHAARHPLRNARALVGSYLRVRGSALARRTSDS